MPREKVPSLRDAISLLILRMEDAQHGGDSADMLQESHDLLMSFVLPIRTRMNAQSPINALPVELLSLIFESHVAPPPGTLEGSESWWQHMGLRLQKATHLQLICRHWRDVAQRTPFLWTAFDATGKPDSEALQLWHLSLERSGCLPLTLHVAGSLSHHTELVFKSNRIRSLKWNSFRGNHQELLVHLGILETLEWDDFGSLTGENSQTDLSELARYSPCLRILQLEACAWVPSGVFKNLTHLHLRSYSGDMSSVLLWLQRCPVLQDMVLQCPEDGDLGDLGDLDSISVVSLPHLRALVLSRVSWNHLAAIVPRLDISPTAAVQFHDWERGSEKIDCARMLGSPHFHRIVLVSHCHALVAGTDSGISFFKDRLSFMECHLSWTSELSAMVPMATIKELWFSASVLFVQDLGTLLAELSGLTSIHVTSTQLRDVLQALRRERDQQGAINCPELKAIHVFVEFEAAAKGALAQFEALLDELGSYDMVIEHLPDCDVDGKVLCAHNTQLLSRVRVVKCDKRPGAGIPAACSRLPNLNLDADEDKSLSVCTPVCPRSS